MSNIATQDKRNVAGVGDFASHLNEKLDRDQKPTDEKTYERIGGVPRMTHKLFEKMDQKEEEDLKERAKHDNDNDDEWMFVMASSG